MEGGKGEPGPHTHIYSTFASWRGEAERDGVPEEVKGGREEQLVVDGDAHEARLVEGGGDRSDGRPQGAAPAQEEQLGYGGRATQVRQRAFLMQRC